MVWEDLCMSTRHRGNATASLPSFPRGNQQRADRSQGIHTPAPGLSAIETTLDTFISHHYPLQLSSDQTDTESITAHTSTSAPFSGSIALFDSIEAPVLSCLLQDKILPRLTPFCEAIHKQFLHLLISKIITRNILAVRSQTFSCNRNVPHLAL